MRLGPCPPNSDWYFIINVRDSLKFLRVEFVRLVCGELSQKLWSRGLKVESRRVQIWKFKTKPSLAKWYILPVISWNDKSFVRLWLIDLTHFSFMQDSCGRKGKIKDTCINYFKDARVNSHISNSFQLFCDILMTVKTDGLKILVTFNFFSDGSQ